MNSCPRVLKAAALAVSLFAPGRLSAEAPATTKEIRFNDAHVHLTNYIQEGADIHDFLKLMGNAVPRSVLFGIPLQQLWQYRVSGDHAPTYYLDTDAPLYYYAFTDAFIAKTYQSLSPEERARFDPMITGFNPTDMYAADHIRRVLTTFPGVFSGIGEFTIHKEFVSPKIAGPVASLTDPALDRLLDFAGEAGLVAIVHNDIQTPFPKSGKPPAYLEQLRSLFGRHQKTTIIWAHTGLGRIIQPVERHAAMLETFLANPEYRNLYFDISWSEVAKYVVSSPEATQITANLINKYPDRFLFGTDEVAPATTEKYFSVARQFEPLWSALTPEASEKVRLRNYERLFDQARQRVRAWEKKNVPQREAGTGGSGREKNGD